MPDRVQIIRGEKAGARTGETVGREGRGGPFHWHRLERYICYFFLDLVTKTPARYCVFHILRFGQSRQLFSDPVRFNQGAQALEDLQGSGQKFLGLKYVALLFM
jgi:hypothetical protein